MRDMHTTDAPAINSAATAATSSPSTTTQQASRPTATAAPLEGPTPPALRADLLSVADTLAARIHDCRINALDWLLRACLKIP